jgi:hypothetical protein
MLFGKMTAASAVAMLSLAAFTASAANVEVRCEKRANRSKISIDGSNLRPGTYRAIAKSGDKTRGSDFQPAVGDEAQFDFDSNQNDIAEGATPIPANFIVNGRVKGFIVNESNQRVTPVVEAICRVRN